jgi:predicted phage replisome organizer
MAEYNKEQLFYLKLNKDFFDQHYIKILETQPNGDKYVLFLVKLMCESISHNGYLRFNESIPYDENMLASITRTDIDVVRSAIKIFQMMDIIEFTPDKTLFIKGVPLLTTNTTKGAEKKAEQREKKLLQLDNRWTKGGQMSTQRLIEADNSKKEETREEKVVHMSSLEEHMSTRDKSIEIRDKSIELKELVITPNLTIPPKEKSVSSKIDYLNNYSNDLITKENSRDDFDYDKFNEWLEEADVKSKDYPNAWFKKVFPIELEKGTFNKVVKPEPPKTDDLPSWEEMIDDLNPTENNDPTSPDYLEQLEKENK